MVRPLAIVVLCALFIPSIASATHCTACLTVDAALNPSAAWQTVAGSTAGTPNQEYTYRFCAVQGQPYDFSFCQQGGSATWDTALSVWADGGTACGAQLLCNDDFCGLQSELTWVASGNGNFLIQVDGFGGSTGTYVLAYRGTRCTATPVAPSTWGSIKSQYLE